MLRQERTYFDSGDYALSQARKPSDIGKVETGAEHPLRVNISQPASAVPASSNVMNRNNDAHVQHRQQSAEVKHYSHLHEQVGQAREREQ